MIAALATSPAPRVQAESPEALDAEFLDYLVACEGADDNWTVVAADPPPRTPKEENEKEKPVARPPDPKAGNEEARP
jgi:hypothetical protein